MPSITAHCLVKNEEAFVAFAVRSVIDFVDQIFIFDTGSEDSTVAVLTALQKEFPHKILFEEKGTCTKEEHTLLRNEMIERTKTDWFMVLDGDEVWTTRALDEAQNFMRTESAPECLMAPFYLCVGDIFHETICSGSVKVLGRTGFFTQRFLKKTRGIHWEGKYGFDTVYDEKGAVFFSEHNTQFLEHKFWHLTHLRRSSVLSDFSSGAKRGNKLILTYFLVGRKINESVPEVFNGAPLRVGFIRSFFQFFGWVFSRMCYKIYRFFTYKPV
jgi:glycosyltransferase involved in cell wall biosynthesis